MIFGFLLFLSILVLGDVKKSLLIASSLFIITFYPHVRVHYLCNKIYKQYSQDKSELCKMESVDSWLEELFFPYVNIKITMGHTITLKNASSLKITKEKIYTNFFNITETNLQQQYNQILTYGNQLKSLDPVIIESTTLPKEVKICL